MKNKKDSFVDELFSDARKQPAKISFDDISEQLNTSIINSSNLTKKWYSKLIHLNSIIMLSTILITGIVCFTLTNQTENNTSSVGEIMNKEVKFNSIKTIIPSTLKNQSETQKMKIPPKDENRIVEEQITIEPIDSIEKLIEINYPEQNLQLTAKPAETTITVKQDSLYKTITYTITEKTTLKELEDIEKHAKSCNIDYTYNVKHKRNTIKMIRLKMLIENTDGKKKVNQFYCKGSAKSKFDYEIKWRVDSKGKVVDFAGNSCVVIVNSES